MIITHKLQPMDLTHKQNTIRVDVVQDDKYSRDIEFTLTENGVAWQIPDGTTAVVRYKKPDGTGGNYDTLPDGSTAYQINGNGLTVALAPQVCTVQGTVQLSVGLIQGSAEINTFTVNIVVQPNPGATYQSEDYIKLSGAVPNSGWTPNAYLGTDAQGNVVAKEGTSGGGGTSGKDGVGIQSVEQTTTSSEDGGTNIVTVTKTDGTSSTFQVKNGSKGSTGQAGTNGKSAYQYAQDGGYTGTGSEFAAKLAEEYIPSPATATVGQTIVVKAVDENGKPTEWEAADMANGGSAGLWEHICDITTTEELDAGIEITKNEAGILLSDLKYNEIFVLAKMVGVSTNTNSWWACRCYPHLQSGTQNYANFANGAVSGGTNKNNKYTPYYFFIRGGKMGWTDAGDIDPYDMQGFNQAWVNHFLDQYNFDYFEKVVIPADSTRVIGVDTEIRVLGRHA